jgi:dihydroneopterin aldolase
MQQFLLRDLAVWTRIGTTDEERRSPQQLLVTVTYESDTIEKVAQSDDVRDGIDYCDIIAIVNDVATKERKTIERFALDIIDALRTVKGMQKLNVSVEKKTLPNLGGAIVHCTHP